MENHQGPLSQVNVQVNQLATGRYQVVLSEEATDEEINFIRSFLNVVGRRKFTQDRYWFIEPRVSEKKKSK